MIYIDQKDYNKIIQHCLSELPNEACGLLVGGDSSVQQVYPMTNVDASPTHFSLDPKEQIAVQKELRAKGYQLLAIFHSHPKAEAYPSEEDCRLANDNVLHCIVSLQKEPEMKVYRIDGMKVEGVELSFSLKN